MKLDKKPSRRGKKYRAVYGPDKKTVIGHEHILSGLRPSIRQVFWPDYDYHESGGSVPGSSASNGVRNAREGKNRGKIVHTEIEDFVNRKNDKEFRIKHPYPSKGCVLFIRALAEYKLKAIFAEFKIFDEDASIGTAIDVMARTQSGRLILLEVKTGFAGYMDRSNAPMHGELSDLNNCPLHQAYIQLLMERAILEYRYNIVADACFVIQINEQGVTPHKIPDALIHRQQKIYQYFVRTRKNLHFVKYARARRGTLRASKKKKPVRKKK